MFVIYNIPDDREVPGLRNKGKRKIYDNMGSLHEIHVRGKIEVSMAVCGVCVLSQVTEIHAVTGD